MECYFDNSATTKPTDAVVKDMVKMLTVNYGNPSSLHHAGDMASFSLEHAREAVAKSFGCEKDEVIFTSGGTESNNIAIMGAAHALKKRGNRIVTTSIEHPSVLKCMDQLESEGFEIIKLPVDERGFISENALFEAINENTILVSMMYVNNEIGTIQPIKIVKTAIMRSGAPALIHCDAVQAYGKLDCNVRDLGVDLMSVSSHKIHGPKGQGALYVKKGTRLAPYVFGGGQENEIRSGTQNMPGIVGFATAVSEIEDIDETYEQVAELKKYLCEKLKDVENITYNANSVFPYILNMSLVGVPAEVLRNYLSSKGIYVSTGSACSKGHRSYVLLGMGVDPKVIDSAIRISFSRFNTKAEVKYLAETIIEANNKLRKV